MKIKNKYIYVINVTYVRSHMPFPKGQNDINNENNSLKGPHDDGDDDNVINRKDNRKWP